MVGRVAVDRLQEQDLTSAVTVPRGHCYLTSFTDILSIAWMAVWREPKSELTGRFRLCVIDLIMLRQHAPNKYSDDKKGI